MINKVVSNLPAVLEKDSIYIVYLTGGDIDLYVTDNTTNPQALRVSSKKFDPETAKIDNDGSFIYRAWEKKDRTGYEAVKYNLETGLKDGTNSGVLPIPEDLKILIYI